MAFADGSRPGGGKTGRPRHEGERIIGSALSRRLTGTLGLLFLAACGAGPQAAAPTPTPAPVTGPRVVLPSGAVYRVELTLTPEEHAQGLMFRESLPPRTGMLFLFSDGGPHRFWMKNTMIPLDMIWLDAEGRVLFISANTPPCKADPCPNYGPETPVSTVLEIAGGMAEKEGVKVGSRISLLDIPTPLRLSPPQPTELQRPRTGN